jgi:hypothetical protein
MNENGDKGSETDYLIFLNRHRRLSSVVDIHHRHLDLIFGV